MQLSEIAKEEVRKNRRCINRLALQLDVHSASIERWLKDNAPDGDLTKATALEIIAEETGVSKNKILVK